MQNVNELKEKAYSFIELKEYKKAIEIFYKLLLLDSSYEQTYLLLAQTFHKMNNFERSKDYYYKILELNPSSLEAFKGLSVLYRKYEKYDQALEYINKAMHLEDSIENVEFKSQILIRLAKYQEAIDTLNPIIDSNNAGISVLNSIAFCFLNLGDIDKAIEFYQKSTELEPNTTANIGLAKVYIQSDLIKAKDIIERVLTLDFNNISAHHLLAEIFYKQKKYEKAIAQYNFILTIKKNDLEALNNLGVTYSEIGWHDQAINVYKEILKLAPYNKDIRYALAYTYYINKEYVNSRKELRKNDNHIKSNILEAQIEFKDKKYTNCIELLEDVLANDKDNVHAIELLARTYDEIELKDKTLGYYQKALELGTDDINIKYKASVFFNAIGEVEKSFELLQEVLEQDNDNIDASLLLAELYYSKCKYEKALAILHNLLQKNKNIVEAYPIAAKAALAIDNTSLARDYLYETIKKLPSDPQGYYLTGIFMERIEEPDEAETFYEEAVGLDETNLLYINAFADYYFNYYDFENALKWYKKSLNLCNDEEIEVKLLNCYVELKQFDKLKKHLKKAKSKKLDALFMIHK